MSEDGERERRHFHRIRLEQPGSLEPTGGEAQAVTVQDISLHGARLVLPPGAGGAISRGTEARLTLPFADGAAIEMALEVRHRDGDTLGCACRRIDIDSVSRLRRLVELNLGDPDLLQRDLAELAG